MFRLTLLTLVACATAIGAAHAGDLKPFRLPAEDIRQLNMPSMQTRAVRVDERDLYRSFEEQTKTFDAETRKELERIFAQRIDEGAREKNPAKVEHYRKLLAILAKTK